jgi:hypothetical protein
VCACVDKSKYLHRQVDGRVESETALVGAESRVELDTVAAVHLELAGVILPDDAELDDALGDGDDLEGGLELGVLLEQGAVLEGAHKLWTGHKPKSASASRTPRAAPSLTSVSLLELGLGGNVGHVEARARGYLEKAVKGWTAEMRQTRSSEKSRSLKVLECGSVEQEEDDDDGEEGAVSEARGSDVLIERGSASTSTHPHPHPHARRRRRRHGHGAQSERRKTKLPNCGGGRE